MSDLWRGRLSEYLDDELETAERVALEGHLAGCAECRGTVEELRAVVQRAATLEARPPAADLWPAIAARIAAPGPRLAAAPERRRRMPRWSFSLPQLAAAAAAIALVSSVAMWLALGRGPAPRVASVPEAARPVPGAAVPASFDVQRYDATIAELETALREHRHELDPATVRTIEQNLRIIDQATEQARRALAADPANPYLNGHLAAQLRLKVDVLKQATAWVSTRG
ncbi:MAG TPA: zf-HC2 domain-containing protein [Terriglobales bacterium]|nr:zf-HC2 domain-containing protein [Terriglobales bacterium]